jgi:hypothetical protein
VDCNPLGTMPNPRENLAISRLTRIERGLSGVTDPYCLRVSLLESLFYIPLDR